MSSRAARILLVAAILLFALPGTASATAGDCDDDARELSPAEVQAVVDAYNQNAGDLPGFLTGQVAGERVELRITGASAAVYTVTFDEAARAATVSEGVADPTLRITVASETLCTAIQSENPGAALAGAYQHGDVDVEGVGTANAIKVTLLETAIGIAQFFGLV